eukprot:CAMPEP_0202942062 /NCGR_PEP_ID=MMETSP1395-20130829/2234_1 /ASSEMBLY_ACC=CAM_ASM_000871 /TAXON_ID=5961 /ORGANISM="Blepharisma japonicum, Strain Stock R1072" /LENGTH=55 /DNA_ID=CAMNT_0049637917 /DNA_START=662 /DNA_END=829 /DNA_ORIENTATION=+
MKDQESTIPVDISEKTGIKLKGKPPHLEVGTDSHSHLEKENGQNLSENQQEELLR